MKQPFTKLYFIAVVPEEPLQSELMKFKNEAKSIFNAGHALSSPAHITIIPPFNMPAKDESQLKNDIIKSIGNIGEIYLEINGFGHFGKRVLFVNVEENKQLDTLYYRLKTGLSNYYDENRHGNKRFNPHITVASRDLISELFPSAWDYFSGKEYFRVFKAGTVDILRHENRLWKSISSIKL